MYEFYCKARDNKGYKDADVVRLTGIPQSTFSDWKSGRSNPKGKKLTKIAECLGVTVKYLETGEADEDGYYLDKETAKMAQEMYEDADMRTLYDMKRNMPADRFSAHVKFMKELWEKEHPSD